MQTKIELLILLTLTLIASVNLIDLGGECSDKAIFSGNNFKYDTYEDQKCAYHGVSSCISLHTEEEDSLCCYVKIKYRNKYADKKFTHRGCIEVVSSNLQNFDTFKDQLEDSIKTADSNIDKVDLDIDCNSKFIKITGLILLAFLL